MMLFIVNIVTFVSACIILVCLIRSNKKYTVLHDEYLCLKKANEDSRRFCLEKGRKLADLRSQLERCKPLDCITKMSEIEDYKSVLLAITVEYEKQHRCRVDRVVISRNDCCLFVRVEI